MLSTAVIMEGFDIVLINSLLAVDEFQRTFGRQLSDGSYELSAAWQAGLTNGAIVGEILGLMLNGIIADRFGFKKTMIGALTAITGLIFIPFFSTSPVQLLVGLILMGQSDKPSQLCDSRKVAGKGKRKKRIVTDCHV